MSMEVRPLVKRFVILDGGGPELHTITAFEGDELVGSVMSWQTGAVERLFVVPR